MSELLQPVTVYHLEMLDPSQLVPARSEARALEVVESRIPIPEYNRFLYSAVGGDYFWRDRLSWDYARWMQVLNRPGYETWVGFVHGAPCGYFELDVESDSVEIAYFGLLPQFVGKGFGGALLSRAIERGWEKGARRVWVHTCSLDHPAALSNYQARGLRLFKEEVVYVPALGQAPGAWPEANRPIFAAKAVERDGSGSIS
jgi:GNAT superfamily N-acetyltransferase